MKAPGRELQREQKTASTEVRLFVDRLGVQDLLPCLTFRSGLLLRILEVLCSNLARRPAVLTEYFVFFLST
jgi:hypothetical protein